ncbi:MAG: D-alanyl-D-alanine carboxypeptidase [Chromatiales bacterium]|nr:D-alanyl-D-alanine carboxypeptidase [Chromatiales bacterium]
MTFVATLRSSAVFMLTAFMLMATLPARAAAPTPTAPTVNASGYLLMDFNSGQILAEGNARDRLEPASLTKLMTAYIVFNELSLGNIKLTDQVPVSENAWRTQGSRSFIEVNTRVQLETLIKGVIVQSGNDASVALAEYIAGSEDAFADLMNNHARALNMTGTHFVNSTGLPSPEHYTTAADLALLMQAIIHQFPEYYKFYSIKEYSYNGITQPNRNRLLTLDPSVDGGKTGHTDAAGYCLVASAMRDGMRLISVVLGTRSDIIRAQETQKLINYGFRFFDTRLVHKAAEPVTTTRVWQGASEEIALGIAQDLYVTVPRNAADRISANYTVNQLILAPVAQGAQFGQFDVSLDGENIASRPLIAVKDIGEGSFAHRFADRVLLFFQ